VIQSLALVGEIVQIPAGSPLASGFSAQVVNELVDVRLDLTGLIDFEKELASAQGKKAKIIGNYEKLKQKIESPAYAKVPPNVQEKERERFAQLTTEVTALDDIIASLTQSLQAQK
jgi:valyl-tRNA synthetase